MSAGLPGLGLGGVFFLLQALVAPLFELGRAARGRSTPQTRHAVARQFAIAVGMVVLVGVVFGVMNAVLTAAGVGDGTAPTKLMHLPIGATALALLTLGFALALVEIVAPLAARARPPRTRATSLRPERLQRERRGF